MWLLFTAIVGVALILMEWLPVLWPFYHELPVISLLETLGPGGKLLASMLAAAVVTLLLYSLIWLIGHGINYLRPRWFEDFTTRLNTVQGLAPAMLGILVGVPIVLGVATYMGRGSLYAWSLGLLMMITAAFNLRPFSIRTQLLPALAAAPAEIARGENPWAPIPLEADVMPEPNEPPAPPPVIERLEGGAPDWLAADLS